MNSARSLLTSLAVSLLMCSLSIAQQPLTSRTDVEAKKSQANGPSALHTEARIAGKPSAGPQAIDQKATESAPPIAAQTQVSGVLGRDQRAYQSVAQPGGFRVGNPRQGVSAEFAKSGVDFHSGNNAWGVALQGYGYGEKIRASAKVAPHADLNRIEYRRGELTEWYVNGALGLEQGFTLAHAPGRWNGKPLTLTLALSGDLAASVDADARGLTLKKNGIAALHYGNLTVNDARGRELHAWMEVAGNKLSLRVNDANAVYPVTVDPYVQVAKLNASDGATNGGLVEGSVISSDGNTIVSANQTAGAVYVFVKSADGWGSAIETCKLAVTNLGASVSFTGAVAISGDGNTIAASAVRTSPSGQAAVYVFTKPSGGWSESAQSIELTPSDGTAADFVVLPIVAVNYDGSTVVMGAPAATIGSNGNQGAAYLFVEPAGGWIAEHEAAKLTASDGESGDLFGYSLAISGDGLTVIVGGPQGILRLFYQGFVYVFTKLSGNWSTATETGKLAASGSLINPPSLGGSIAISSDGSIVAAESNFNGPQIFVRPAGGWTSENQTTNLADPGGANLNNGVSLSGDGTIAAVTGFNGTLYLFGADGVDWTSPSETAKIVTSDETPISGAAINYDGTTIGAEGAQGANPAAIYVFTGSASTANAILDTGSITFGSQNPGTTSSPQQVTLSNTGGLPLHVTNVVASANFVTTTNCVSASPLTGGYSCTENVSFAPNSSGPFSGTLTFTDDSGAKPGSTQNVSLSGMGGTGGTSPAASLSPASLSFGNQAIGTSSGSQSVTLTNTGSSSLHVSSVGFSGPSSGFSATHNCVSLSPLAAGGSCSENVTFTPTASGPSSATLTFTDDSGGSPGATQSASLSGTGAAPQTASPSPTSLSFGSQAVGSNSPSQVVTLTNTGGSTLRVSDVAASANFLSSGDCLSGASTVAPGASCFVNVIFAPGSTGLLNGTLTFTDDSGGAAGATQTVSLSGTGATPGMASVSPLSISFGNQAVSTTSTPQTVTLTNSGGSILHISGIVASANFSSTQHCLSGPLAPGGSCSENVSFTPGSAGILTGTLTFTDDSGGTAGGTGTVTQSVMLSGTGAVPNASLSPASLNFGNQGVGTTSSPQTVTLTNTGGAPLHVSAVTGPPPPNSSFTFTQHCVTASPLAAGASCSESVSFTPSAAGPFNGTVTFTDDGGSGGNQSVTLSGTGATPQAAVSPTNLNFGSLAVGTTSNAQAVTLTNTGGAPLHVTGVAIGANFTSTHNCVTVSPLAPGGTCSESVSFAPGSLAALGGTLVFVDDSGGTPGATQLLPLAGTGIKATSSTRVSATPTTLLTGQQVTVTFSVTRQLGDALTPTGTVSVAATTGENCSGPATSGSCLLTFQSTGTRTISASYGGDGNFVSSTSTGVQVSVTAPTADLFVSQAPSLTSVKSGSAIAYALTVKNFGPNTSASVTMTDAVPANSTFASISSGAPCTAPAVGSVGTISCTWASLANGASASMTFTVAVGGSGNKTAITNTVAASSATFDPNLANNTATITTQISGNKK